MIATFSNRGFTMNGQREEDVVMVSRELRSRAYSSRSAVMPTFPLADRFSTFYDRCGDMPAAT